MGQAVAVSGQYADVADGLRGRVGNLSQAMVGLTQRFTGFNKINTVALDTAASYQKALSGIETTAAATGKSFDALSATTRKMARDFPIGLGGAVEVVESLQSVGVKSERQIDALGKSFVRLGAATGSNSAGIGRDMTLLMKTMGNGTAQFEALSDSLVTVTKQFGASAPNTIAFSKALAPIASTVGMSQTAVMGLSAAMSSLGEDGYRAANTFNKVLLDMNRAVRDGGPELRAYADVMGTTSEKLRDLFKQNPSEMLARFTEALGKQGANSARSLEALGFDSVRDTRSLQAVSRSGLLREAISTSVGAYGSGSTQKASDVALGGVQDSAARLQETMSQTVENLGKPLLGMARTQLDIANSVAGAMEKVTGSTVGQGASGVAGVAGGVAGAGMNILGTLTLAALAKTGFNALKGSSLIQGIGTGRQAAIMGTGAPTGLGRMAGAGAGFGYGMQNALMAGGLASPGQAWGTAAGLFGKGTAVTADVANRWMTGYYRNMLRGGMGEQAIRTPEGQRFLDSSKTLAQVTKANALGTPGPWMTTEEARRQAIQASGAYFRGYGTQGAGTSLGRLAGTAGMIGVDAGRFAGGMAMKGAGMALGGLNAMGLTGPGIAIAAGVGLGTYAYSQKTAADDRQASIGEYSQDIYSRFNSFAEAAGQAGRGLVAFNAAIQQSTQSLSKQNTSMAQALTLTSAEVAQSSQAGYKTAFNLIGNTTDSRQIASQLTSVLGPNAAPQDVARGMQDIASVYGPQVAAEAAKYVEEFYKSGGAFDYKALADNLVQSGGFMSTAFGINESQTGLVSQNLGAFAQRQYENQSRYAGTMDVGGQTISAGTVTALEQARAVFEQAQATLNPASSSGDVQAFTQQLEKLLGATPDQAAAAGIDSSFINTVSPGTVGGIIPSLLRGTRNPLLNGTSFEDWLKGAAEAGIPQAQQMQAALGSGLTTKDLGKFAGTDETMKAAEDFATSLDNASGTGSRTTDMLFSLGKVAADTGYAIEALPEKVLAGLTPGQRALQGAIAQPESSRAAIEAGKEILAAALADTQGNTTAAKAMLEQKGANTPLGQPGVAAAIEQALTQLEGITAIRQAGMSRGAVLNEQIRQGQIAQQAPITSNTAISNQMQIVQGQQAQAQMLDQGKNFVTGYQQMLLQIRGMQRSAGVQMGAIARDGALKVKWATEDYHTSMIRAEQDYNKQRRYAEADYNRQAFRMARDFRRSQRYAQEDYDVQRFRATRDFNTQMRRSERDYNLQKERANRDFNLSLARADEDYRISTQRAQEDFSKSRLRAEEDYQKSVMRATRDFGIQQAQAEQDYLRARSRAVEDYNKQVKRLVEDGAKSMYDPYKRIAAQMVMDAGQLVTNLKDQTAAINKQVGNLAAVRSMGMSEQAIKALGLADAQNAQQLQRILSDSQGNPDFINQLNQQVAAKETAAGSLVTDQGSTQFSRMQEDFNTSLARMDEDFSIATTRANEAFARSMSDAAIDFATNLKRMDEDFALSMVRSEEDFQRSKERQIADFATQMADAEKNFQTSMADAKENFDTAMADMEQSFNTARTRAYEQFYTAWNDITRDHDIAMTRMAEAYQLQIVRAEEDFTKAITRMKIQTANAISDVGASVGAQITNMKEQFAGLFTAFTGGELDTAKKVMETFKALGFDRSELSSENQALWDWAQGVIDASKTAGDAMGDFYAKGGMPRATPTPAAAAPTPTAAPAVDTSIWDNMWPDDWSSIMPTIDWAALWDNVWPDNWDFLMPDIDWAGIWDTMIENMKRGWNKLTDFDAIARSLGEGLGRAIKGIFAGGSFIKDSIGNALGNAWDFLTETIPDIGEALGSAFESAETFLTGLPATITGWIGNAWDWLTTTIPDIGANILTAFESARTFLTGLPATITEWIGDAWHSLISALVGGGEAGGGALIDIGGAVLTAFETAKNWITGLPERVLGWVGSAWEGLSSQIPELKDIGTTVEEAFNTAKTWITGLPARVLEWIGTTWDGLTSTLPTLSDVGDAVSGVFTEAWKFLGNLAGPASQEGSILNAIGDAWEALTSWLPTPATMLKAIKVVFEGEDGNGGLKGFLMGIATWIVDNIPSATEIAGAFGSLVDGARTVIRNLMNMWNALEWKVDFDFGPIGPIGKIDGWEAKTINIGGEERTIIPAWGGWAGFNFPKVGIHTGDLIPNIPIPDILQSRMGGGPVERAKAYMVGESGPELFLAPADGQIVPHGIANRIASAADARSAMMQPYATVVNAYNSYSYDQSTRITGPITVQAQDPDEMAAKLEARRRRQRLVNPIGSQS